MAQSMNTKVDYSVAASSFLGLSSQGKVMVGDAAFEYYNDRNVEDYIQIPWEEVDYIQASVLFGKWINRFAIYTKKNNKQLLREVRKYVPQEKMYRSLTFFQVITRGVKGIVRRILRK